MRRLLFLVGLGTLGLGVYKFYLRQISILEEFDWSIANIKIGSILPNIKVFMTFNITNNSELTATIEGYDVDVLVNGNKISTIKNMDISKKLKGFGGKTGFNLVVDIKYSDLGIGTGGFNKLLSGVLNDTKNSTLRLKGYVDIKRSFISLPKYPVDVVFKLSELGL